VFADSSTSRSRKRLLVVALCHLFTFVLTFNLRSQPSQGGNREIIPVSAALCDDMIAHHVLGAIPIVGCDRLRLVKFSYIDFDGISHADGEIIVMDVAASYVSNIFGSLFSKRFPISKARLMNAYDGNDDASMADNNTSAFNDRMVTNSDVISLHAYGLAIDINPIQNPYMKRSDDVFRFQPPAGAIYANRLSLRPWKDVRAGMAETIVDVFAENGFMIWGGYWDNPIDYQHFQVGRQAAERLAGATPLEAEMIFNQMVERYRTCRQTSPKEQRSAHIECVVLADPTGNEPNH